jgi:hypothetical protein
MCNSAFHQFVGVCTLWFPKDFEHYEPLILWVLKGHNHCLLLSLTCYNRDLGGQVQVLSQLVLLARVVVDFSDLEVGQPIQLDLISSVVLLVDDEEGANTVDVVVGT